MTLILTLRIAISCICVFAAVTLFSTLVLDIVDSLLDRYFSTQADRWRQLRMSESQLRLIMRGWLLVQVVVPALLLLLQAWPLALTSAVLILRTPAAIFSRLIRLHELQLEEQLVPACRGMASGVLAGLSIPQGLESAIECTGEPLQRHFKETVVRLRRGQTVGEVLETLRSRLLLDSVSMFCRVLEVADRQGGPMNPKLTTLSDSLHEWARVRRKLESETASARFSLRIMSLCPVLFMVLLSAMGMNSVSAFFVTTAGQIVLSVIGIMIWTGNLWATRILRVAMN